MLSINLNKNEKYNRFEDGLFFFIIVMSICDYWM